MRGRQAVTPKRFDFFDHTRYTYSLGLKVGGSVWLSGQLAGRYDPRERRIVVDEAIEDQVLLIHSMIETILAAEGLDQRAIIKINDYLTPDGIEVYERVVDVRNRLFSGRFPAVTSVVVDRLMRPDALIEVEVVASGAPGEVRVVQAEGTLEASAVRMGDLVYVSAQSAMAEDGSLIGADLASQTRQVYENIARALVRAGTTTKHIVKTVHYLAQSVEDQLDDFIQVRRAYLGEPWPANTDVFVSRLPNPRALLQADVFAYDGHREAVGSTSSGRNPQSPAIKAEQYVFLSGETSEDPQTGEAEFRDDVVLQSQHVYRKLLDVLGGVGLSEAAILKTVEYITPAAMANYRGTAQVRKTTFSRPYPVSTGVVIPRLRLPGLQLLVDSVALAP
jgi:enamine deaminase RidA (YjgF/YER057c/UK114 family)